MNGPSFEPNKFDRRDEARIFQFLQQVPHFALHTLPSTFGGANLEVVSVPDLICGRDDEARGVYNGVSYHVELNLRTMRMSDAAD